MLSTNNLHRLWSLSWRTTALNRRFMFNVLQLIVIHHLHFSVEWIDLWYLSMQIHFMPFFSFAVVLRCLCPRLHPTHCQRPSHCFLPQSHSAMAISWPFTFHLIITSLADKRAYKKNCWIDWLLNFLSHDSWVMVLKPWQWDWFLITMTHLESSHWFYLSIIYAH